MAESKQGLLQSPVIASVHNKGIGVKDYTSLKKQQQKTIMDSTSLLPWEMGQILNMDQLPQLHFFRYPTTLVHTHNP